MTEPQEQTEQQTGQQTEQQTEQHSLVAEDLVEEVSIDGMCGVY